jgi:hypothetical protein
MPEQFDPTGNAEDQGKGIDATDHRTPQKQKRKGTRG